jgi:ADP-heptose:LPS heptosyltransferase
MPVIIRRRVEYQKPEKIRRTLKICDFYEKRNKILIIRSVGGLGDILMHRMMFEDFHKLMPDAEIHFACPSKFHDAVRDHPFITKVLDSEKVSRHDYIISYNTTTACGRYEMRLAPFSGDHRSDIWANHCGVNLTSHDMHVHLSEDEIKRGREKIEEQRDRDGPSVVIAPISAMENKNLMDHQLGPLVDGLRERGYFPFGMHTTPIELLVKKDVPHIYGVDLRTWMAVIKCADYVISVDTAAFHLAGGLRKPLVGIFTFADGVVYGKHFDFFLVQRHRNNDPTWTCGPCYNWGLCPKTKCNPKPCLTEITANMILDKADAMFEKWAKSSLS